MKTSDAINELAAALSLAQGEFPEIGKDKTAKIDSTKGSYSYSYSDLASIIKAVRPILAKHGLALVQPASNEPGAVLITTRLMHSSGQWIEEPLTMPVGDNRPQTIGSAITYGRRYAAAAMLGISSEEDDDGAGAQAAAPAQRQQQRQQAPANRTAPAPAPVASGIYRDIPDHKALLWKEAKSQGLIDATPLSALHQACIREKVQISNLANAVKEFVTEFNRS